MNQNDLKAWLKNFSSAITILSILCSLNACSTDYAPKLAGAWEIDSVFDYHNGFTFTNRAPSPKERHTYSPDGTMLREGMGEKKQYYYELNKNQLIIRDLPNASVGNEMEIIKLDSNQLVLKKNKRPLFEGKKEVRYELRYFSRKQ
jgi:hypothetical protein